MSTNFAKHVNPSTTPQSSPIPGRETEMVKNNAGGYTFTLSPLKAVERFLILGTEGGTYYATERKHTVQATDNLKRAIKETPYEVIDLIIDISDKGRASKNDAALFALAAVMKYTTDEKVRYTARQAFSKVVRIGTHLFHFAEFQKQLGKGWGSGTKRMFQNWYTSKAPGEIALQAIKYMQRDGWSHRDILRLAHPNGSPEQNAVFNYITKQGNVKDTYDLPSIMQAAIEAKTASKDRVIQLITEHDLPREAIRTELLNDCGIWEALLPHMGITALVRNLGKMTSIGLLAKNNILAKSVAEKLRDPKTLKQGRVHPILMLNALKTYGAGRGDKGSLVWNPVPIIRDALEDGFQASFDFQRPSGKDILLAVDVSGSMHWGNVAGANFSPAEAAAVMALVTAKVEPSYQIMAFSTKLMNIDITAKDSFQRVKQKLSGLNFGGTDCGAPMVHATANKMGVDVFHIYTDNETWAGNTHPREALAIYRKKMNRPNAKLAVFGMTATDFTIADPKDPGMLDFVGFDTSAPQAAAEFALL